ncbi:MAG: diguanylate cyclase [Thermoleophilia bacterium]
MTRPRLILVAAACLGVLLAAAAATALVVRENAVDRRRERGLTADYAVASLLRAVAVPAGELTAVRDSVQADPRLAGAPLRALMEARVRTAPFSVVSVTRLARAGRVDAVRPLITVPGSAAPPDVGAALRTPAGRAALRTAIDRGGVGGFATAGTDIGTLGVMQMAAVYSGGRVPATVSARRARAVGLVVARLDLIRMRALVMRWLPPGASIRITEGALPFGAVPTPSGTPDVRTVRVADHRLTVRVWVAPAPSSFWAGVLIMAAGILVAGGIPLAIRLSRRQSRADALVRESSAARDRALAELRDSERRFRALVRHAPAGIFQLGPGGELVFANDAWLRITGLDWERARGDGWKAAVHPDDLSELTGWDRHGGARDAVETSFRFVTPEGERHVIGQTSPMTGEGGTHEGWIGTLTDVTQHRLAEIRLAESEMLHRAVVTNAGDAIITTDREGNIRSANPAAERIFGFTRDELLAGNVGMLIDPAQQQAHDRQVRGYHVGQPSEIVGQGRRVMARRKDGTAIPVFVAVSHTDTGRHRLYTAICRDVTAQVAAEERAQRHGLEESALREVATIVAAQATPDTAATVAAQQVARAMRVDLAAVVEFDQPFGDAAVVRAAAASQPAHAVAAGTRLDTPAHGVLATLRATATPVRRVPEPDAPVVIAMDLGGVALLELVGSPIVVDGRVWGALIVGNTTAAGLMPQTEGRLGHFASLVSLAVASAATREQLTRLAITDPLTGLPNRRAFQDRLDAEVQRALRHGRPLSLVVLDLDRFKQINDTHGHDVGDRVLQEVAARLRSEVRGEETLARMGGEEFAWILPECTAADALQAAERARRAIADTQFAATGRVTASFGVCGIEGTSGAAELFRAADAALYRAKAEGRNRTVVHNPPLGVVPEH